MFDVVIGGKRLVMLVGVHTIYIYKHKIKNEKKFITH